MTKHPLKYAARILLLGTTVMTVSACVYEPYPPPPPPPVVAAPGPVYAQPCCYAYSEYPVYGPAYYGPAYGSSVNLSFGRGGWGGHHWR